MPPRPISSSGNCSRVLHDLRFALRLFRRAPLSTAVALLSIALTVGATAVVFAAVKSVLLDPLPYAHPERLVQLRSDFPRLRQQPAGDWVIANDTRELVRRTRTLAGIGVYHNAIFDLAGDPRTPPEALYGLRIDAKLFAILGVSPMLGRNILPEEDRPNHTDVMILSYGLWVRRFHSDRSVVGQAASVNGHACLIAGVMPPGFNFPLRRDAAHTPQPYVEFWAAPLRLSDNPAAGVGAVAGLRPGVTVEQARQEIATISSDMAHDFPAANRDRVLRLNPVRARAVRGAGNALWLLMAAAVVFMLIGCANVANLLLARGVGRRREMAVRLALGAANGRILRQLLTESCLLAVAGGLGGYVFAVASWRILPAIAPVTIPRLAGARADGTVLGFALAVAILNGLLFGIAPALRAGRNPWNAFGARGAAGRRDGVRAWLVAAEVAFSVLLVVVGGQLVSNFIRLVSVNPGFEEDRVVASVVLPEPERYRTPEARGLFYRRMLDAVRAVPGVQAAGTVDALPFSGENHGGAVSGGGARSFTAEVDVIGGDYLQAMGIRLLEGRWFYPDEAASSDTAIVSTYLARRLWPNEAAPGKRVCVYCTPENPSNWKLVVGVVSSARHTALDTPEAGDVYLSTDAMQQAQFIVVRTQSPIGEMQHAIRRAIASVDPNQTVLLSVSMRELVADSIADRRFLTLLVALTASLALLLAAAGIYGVVSYSTSRRTAEIGIRMAVGATPPAILSQIFQQGFFTVAMGLGFGLAASLAALRALRGVLPGLDSGDPMPIGLAVVAVAFPAALACWIPARRATRTDPIAALRAE